jgi:hypothetical protein
MQEQLILKQLQLLPIHLKQEVLDFLEYLLVKYRLEPNERKNDEKIAAITTKIEPKTTIESLKKANNYQGLNRDAFFKAVAALNVQESTEDLLKLL